MTTHKQRDARVPRSLAVIFQDGDSFVKAYVKDVSRGGLFIGTDNPLGEGEKFSLRLRVPGMSEYMQVSCKVAWAKSKQGDKDTRSAGMGVEFLEMTRENLEILEQYTKTLEKKGVKTSEMSDRDNELLQQYLQALGENKESS